MENKGNYLNM